MNAQIKLLAGIFGALSAGMVSAAVTPTVDLAGLGYVTYGDGNSYSLAIGNYFSPCGKEYGTSGGVDCPYNVKGSPGAGSTDPRIYIVEGAGGHQNNGLTNVDDAFDAANNELYFTMDTFAEPGSNGGNGSFTGDKTSSWDAVVSALKSTFDLPNNNLTFFFVNNEPNSQDGLTQNLAVWARITLTDLAGTGIYGTWDVTNDTRTAAQRTAGVPLPPGYGPPPIGGGVPMGDVTLFTTEGNAPEKTDFIMSGGQVCVDKVSKNLVNCSTATPGSFDTINHNLGENQAPYAVLVPELDKAIRGLISGGANLDNYVMRVDLRYGCAPPFTISTDGKDTCSGGTAVSQDNNFEQVFIGASPYTPPPPPVPEPMSLLLLGGGLLGMGAARRQQRR